MNRIGHIDPELHGLLDEIVTDPRSALRLTPRKALSGWLFSDEVVRPSHSATRAERHLLEAHREALADLLIQASRVAFWKAPSMAIRVLTAHGSRIPTITEEALRSLVEVEARQNPEFDPVLGAILGDGALRAEQGLGLARAALALVPSDEARYALAVALPDSEPEGAIRILEVLVQRQERKRNTELAWRILSSLGRRQAAAKRFDSARSSYSRCRGMTEVAIVDEYYIANLSFYMGDLATAREAARQLSVDPRGLQYAEQQRRVMSSFAEKQDEPTLQVARSTMKDMEDLPTALRIACEALR
jgi:hypothetical protein